MVAPGTDKRRRVPLPRGASPAGGGRDGRDGRAPGRGVGYTARDNKAALRGPAWGRCSMQLGMIGLGRMGANIVRRLMGDGHECVVYDVNEASITALEADGATGARTLPEFVAKLTKPRAAWVMIPAGITGSTVEQLAELLDEGDIIIDGGNSNYRDDVRRAAALRDKGIHYVDAGTSGGVFALERGYCLMVGGDDPAVAPIEPILQTLAPGPGTAERTPGRSGALAPEEQGYLHCGPSGAGHFVKMVHNGIEYGIMAALAEGVNVLANADAGSKTDDRSAEIAPLEEPRFYQFDIDTAKVAELWRRGSVVSSWLLDLTAAALQADPTMEGPVSYTHLTLPTK